MDRNSYEKVLKQIEQKSLNEAISFFQSIPIFSQWNHRSLAKLKYYFKSNIYQRNSHVYETGDPPKLVYIVKSGEFGISCQTFQSTKNEDSMEVDTYLNHLSSKGSGNTLFNSVIAKHMFSRPQRKKKLQVKIVGVGDMIGEEDCVLERNRVNTVKCLSIQGELLEIAAEDFIVQAKQFDQTWDLLLNKVKSKQYMNEKLISKYDGFRSKLICLFIFIEYVADMKYKSHRNNKETPKLIIDTKLTQILAEPMKPKNKLKQGNKTVFMTACDSPVTDNIIPLIQASQKIKQVIGYNRSGQLTPKKRSEVIIRSRKTNASLILPSISPEITKRRAHYSIFLNYFSQINKKEESGQMQQACIFKTTLVDSHHK